MLPWRPWVFCIATKAHGWVLFFLQCLVVTCLLFMLAGHGLFVAVVDVYIAVHGVAVILSVHRGSVFIDSILVGIISVIIIAFIISGIINCFCYHYRYYLYSPGLLNRHYSCLPFTAYFWQ